MLLPDPERSGESWLSSGIPELETENRLNLALDPKWVIVKIMVPFWVLIIKTAPII